VRFPVGVALLEGVLTCSLPDVRVICAALFYCRVEGEGGRRMGSLIDEFKRQEEAARAEADRLRARIEELAGTWPGRGGGVMAGDRPAWWLASRAPRSRRYNSGPVCRLRLSEDELGDGVWLIPLRPVRSVVEDMDR
jgi:hypothetical protein